ncbi:tetratricopeptide repeat protein [Chloroflexota bacterium]
MSSSMWKVGQKILGKFEILDIKGGPGKSGMGIVYECYDHDSKGIYALKTYQDRYSKSTEFINLFKNEAEIWVRLGNHQNIVRAYFIEQMNGKFYIIMEYIADKDGYGSDLGSLIHNMRLQKKGIPDIALILNFSIQFCRGMVRAQERFEEMGKTFIHRDIKPANIMVTHNRIVKVTDFGLAKALNAIDEDIFPVSGSDISQGKPSLSKIGKICGTPPYMSPEQCRGKEEIDIRSDIYSFGCVLYEMLSSNYVFEARTQDEFIHHHLNTLPETPGVDVNLDKVVLKCLEKEPENRYRDFKELEAILSGLYYELTGEVIETPGGSELEAQELNNRGSSLAILGFSREAIACFQESLKINPANAATRYNIGTEFLRQGKLNEAIQEYKEVLRLEPNHHRAYVNLGTIYCQQGNLDEGIKQYEQALRIEPDFAETHLNLGFTYFMQQKFDESLREYKEALRINPNLAELHIKCAVIYYNQGKLDESINEYREAISLNPNHAEAHYNLGIIYHEQENFDMAVTEYKEALRINQNWAEVYNNIANTYYAQKNYKEAVSHYEKFIELAPSEYVSDIERVKQNILLIKRMV